MDASGCERAAVVGHLRRRAARDLVRGCAPDRVSALILYGPLTKATRTDDYPWAQTAEWWEEVAVHFEQAWGSPDYLEADVAWRAPSERGNARSSAGGASTAGSARVPGRPPISLA